MNEDAWGILRYTITVFLALGPKFFEAFLSRGVGIDMLDTVSLLSETAFFILHR